jgi:hypothetical protein
MMLNEHNVVVICFGHGVFDRAIPEKWIFEVNHDRSMCLLKPCGTLWDPVGPCGTLWDPVGGGFGTAEWNSAVSCRNSLQQNRPINHWRGLGTMQGCPIGFAFGVHFLVSTHVNFKIQILRANEKNWLQNQSRQMPFRDCVSTFMSCNIL